MDGLVESAREPAEDDDVVLYLGPKSVVTFGVVVYLYPVGLGL